jgi:IS1 family transposase/transposase-like protein
MQFPLTLTCPHCHSSKIVKNGKKRTGKQNYLCKHCGKQFQDSYHYNGASPFIKALIKRALVRNVGVRDCQWIFEVSRGCVLDRILDIAEMHKPWQPLRKHYSNVQMDEFWTFVGNKDWPLWLVYAYSPDNSEIIAYAWGERDTETVKKVYKQLEGLDIDWYYTDAWKPFLKVLPKEKHVIGKENTKHIEGVNTCLRARNRRFVRKTTAFSKSYHNHLALAQAIINLRNRHHTF